MIRPANEIILSEEIKNFIKDNKHPKKPLHYIIIGRKRKGSWLLDSLIKIDYPTVCPVGSKPLKKVLLKKRVLGMIHSHPRQLTIPSTYDFRRAPANKVHIILGKGKPGYWFKHHDHIIEIKVR